MAIRKSKASVDGPACVYNDKIGIFEEFSVICYICGIVHFIAGFSGDVLSVPCCGGIPNLPNAPGSAGDMASLCSLCENEEPENQDLIRQWI